LLGPRGKLKNIFPWLGSLDAFHTLSMSCLESEVILSWAPSYLGSFGTHIEKRKYNFIFIQKGERAIHENMITL
jgi:hypothetical protein